MTEKTVIIEQTGSIIRRKPAQGKTLRSLGLGRIGMVVEHRLTPEIRGMLRVVDHLVMVKELGKNAE
ncbi:MAG: 50S ribosomal protein L30 [Deltaproteobacteria bacterium]|nr:50S ribosomal protein L30 [Deltaproteobacteria bacterium]